MLEQKRSNGSMDLSAGKNPTGSSALQLWLAYPGDLADPATEEACAAILDDAERARAARFRFARHRREYLAAHTLARVALSHAHALPPQSWSFSVNKYGKPSPIPECRLRFNQSDSVELAVCLVALPDAGSGPHSGAAAPGVGIEVGVDVESFARAEEIVPLADQVFSVAERAQLDRLPTAERPDRALSLWTLKEAYIKARGMGLSLPLDRISFLFDGPNTDGPDAMPFKPEAIHLKVDPGVDDAPWRWRFCRFDHAGHRIALAVEANSAPSPEIAPEIALEIYEVRPPLGVPARLAWGAPAWF
jgi:4'-phosphopantetheinyl transferase